ncbi:MAG: hypothetical protein QNJ42_24760 [Crocosphaera sp.]|nr:hypothetical protein [Crocosphaera sp.]
MTHPKPSNSSFRYLIAGLKPLANVKVWGSIGIMALVAFALWQYSRHPEWVGSNQTPSGISEGEFEGEVGNNVDIGVTVQDLEANRLNSPGFPPPSAPNVLRQPGRSPQVNQPILKNNPNNSPLSPSSDENNPDLNPSNPSIKFQPLMPNVKNLGSLFPSLTPSKNSAKPIELPDRAMEQNQTPQKTPLEDAIKDVFSSESSGNRSPQNTKPPAGRGTQPNYPTTVTPPQNNPYLTQPSNNPYTYSPPQPYSQPYGNGRSPAPIPTYPPSPQFPNAYGNGNPNAPTQNNQPRPQPNYVVQPAQVDEYGY